MINHFGELVIWQISKDLYVKLYRLLENSRDYAFKDQLLRATLSISNNIAEGFGRGGKREFLYFLRIAKGSCNEVESMLYILKELSKIDEKTIEELRSDLKDVIHKTSAMMNGVIKKIEEESQTSEHSNKQKPKRK